MANGNEPTKGQKKYALDNLVNNEFFKKVIGGNEIKNNPYRYGQMGLSVGEQTYSRAMASDEANKKRKEIYGDKLEEKEKMGISEEAPYTTNYELVRNIIQVREESFAILSLGDLEEAIKKVVGDLDYSIPEVLKGISQMDLMPKLVNGGKDLTESEKDVMSLIEIYKQAYNTGLAMKTIGNNYLDGFKAAGKQIVDKYKVKKK